MFPTTKMLEQIYQKGANISKRSKYIKKEQIYQKGANISKRSKVGIEAETGAKQDKK